MKFLKKTYKIWFSWLTTKRAHLPRKEMEDTSFKSVGERSDIITAIENNETELWLAPGQAEGSIQGYYILTHLTKTGLLAKCADLEELKVIQTKGIDFFRRHFAENCIFGWRDVQQDRVPYLLEFDGWLVIWWDTLGNEMSKRHTSLHRK